MILRNFIATLRRYKVSSLLNIIGLGVAFASFYLIMVQVHYDFTYNQSLPDSERIYRLEVKYRPDQGGFTPIHGRIATEKVGKQLPQIENYFTKTGAFSDLFTKEKGERADLESELYVTAVSEDAIDFLSIEITAGDVSKMFIENSNNIIISQSVADARNLDIGDYIYSGTHSEKIKTLNIVAIYKDIPTRNVFSDITMMSSLGEQNKNNKYGHMYEYYYKLHNNTNLDELKELVTDIFIQTNKELWGEDYESKPAVQFTAFEDIYFAENSEVGSSEQKGDKQVTYTLILIASVIILIALINFINFFFALVPIRIRAVNARKIFGCSRTNLVLNFLGEAIGLVVCALTVAVLIAESLKESFVTDYISTSTAFGDNLDLVIAVVLFCLVISIVVALYPALYITKFKPALMIKSGFAFTKSGKILRSTLIGVQFITSIVLLSCATFMQIQYFYMLNFDMGVETENIISTRMWSDKVTTKGSGREDFARLAKNSSDIVDVAFSSNSIVSGATMCSFYRIDSVDLQLEEYYVSANLLDFIGVEMVEGEGFVEKGDKPLDMVFVVNEEAINQMDGKPYLEKISQQSGQLTYLGICKNHNYKSLKEKVGALTFKINSRYPFLPNIYIKYKPGADVPSVIEYIRECIAELDPSFYQGSLKFETVDDQIAALYGDERKQSNLILIFTVISIIISLMGVFGLVMFEAQLRQQEIVIRRVHGATVKEILIMINRKFLIIIGVCFAVAVPISCYLMDEWLSTFAYRIDISAWVFLAVLVIITLITTLVVTVQSYKAANSNPADLISKNS